MYISSAILLRWLGRNLKLYHAVESNVALAWSSPFRVAVFSVFFVLVFTRYNWEKILSTAALE